MANGGKLSGIVALGLLAAMPRALAQELTSLPSTWSRDVAGARFANINLPSLCGINTLSAQVVLDRINPDPNKRFGPTARVLLSTVAISQTGNGPRQVTVLEIGAHWDEKVPHARFLRLSIGETLDQLDLGAVPLGEKTALELSWNDDGNVTASVNGGEKLVITLFAPPRSLGLTISGASASFSDIKTGFAGATPPDCPGTPGP